MKWRIVVQLLGLLTGLEFGTILRDFKNHGDKYDLDRVLPDGSYQLGVPIRARQGRYGRLADATSGLEGGLLIASLLAKTTGQRTVFMVLGLVALVPVEAMTLLLMPELNRSDCLREYARQARTYGHVTDIKDASSSRQPAA